MSFRSVTSFFTGLKNKVYDHQSIKRLLADLACIPRETLPLPVLRNINEISAGGKTPAYPGEGIIGTRLESRYRRICFVYQELQKLDFKKVRPGMRFDDFVFEQTDFSIYKKIPRDDFYLFYETGLDDFDNGFYKKNFRINRGAVRAIISRMYRPIDAYYHCQDTQALRNPLFISIMRTLHTSLEFVPVIQRDELLRECTALIHFLLEQGELDKEAFFYLARDFNELFCYFLCNLHNSGVIHADGMTTSLFIAPADDTKTSALTLWGTFRPLNKAYTIALVPAALPFASFPMPVQG
jgi:hypothetical protein